MIEEAKKIYDNATKVEDKIGFLRQIPWWAYLVMAGGVWYLLSDKKEDKKIEITED